MAEERERLCAHVKAAKDWLGRAESSLEKEEDVKGGLNLMLAEAELQRARETRTGKSAARFLAPALAVLLVAGGVTLQRSAEPTPASVEKSPASIVRQGMTVREEREGAAPAGRSESVQNPPEVREAKTPPAPSQLEESTGAEASRNAALAEPPAHQPALEREAEKTEKTSAASLPTEDMQKLMLSAGRVLRE